MPVAADGVTFTPKHNWEADYAATPPIGVSPVRFDEQDADVAAVLTILLTRLSPAGLSAVMTAWLSSLPIAPVAGAPQWWNNGGTPSFS